MAIDSVDLDLLVSLFENSPEVKAIIYEIDRRMRDPRNRETKVGNLEYDMTKHGNKFPVEQLRQGLEKIATAGCGSYKPGRPIGNSRLLWTCSAKELARTVLEKVKETNSNSTVVAENGEFETHFFPVRVGVSLPVNIRSDMTVTELENMSEFVRIIAKSRASNEIAS